MKLVALGDSIMKGVLLRSQGERCHYSLADKIITEVSEAFEEAGKYTNVKLVETRLAYKLGGNR